MCYKFYKQDIGLETHSRQKTHETQKNEKLISKINR